jgi:hypothetical protein
MRLTSLDFLFWAVGFLVNTTLLVILWYRRRVTQVPFFTAMISLVVLKTVVLFLVQRFATREPYFYTYWSLSALDMLLQLCVVYELASKVFRPLQVWAPAIRSRSIWFMNVSVAVALCLAWLASPVAQTWERSIVTKGNLFAEALMSELFIAMLVFSMHAGFSWKAHAAAIAQGLGAYSLVTMLVETGHSYFGVGREMPVFITLSHVRMLAYLGCVTYWIFSLSRDEQPARPMSREMMATVMTLQAQMSSDLQNLRSRKDPR